MNKNQHTRQQLNQPIKDMKDMDEKYMDEKDKDIEDKNQNESSNIDNIIDIIFNILSIMF
jgi:hypothetical protein